MPIRVGFICGKDTDFVEHPGKGPLYSKVGDPSFLADMPDKWRVDPVSHEYLMDCAPGTKGQAHVDVALAWYIHKKYKDIEIDIITPADITPQRLAKNDINYTLGYNAVSVSIEASNATGPRPMDAIMMRAFTKSKNIFPTWEVEDFIMTKSKYMRACLRAGVPMAPTIFAEKRSRSAAKLLAQIKHRGWQRFVMKQSESGFCLGFMKLSVKQCEDNPEILEEYFRDYAHISEFIVQECVDGFTRNWETRVFWFNGKFLYAIANMAAVSTNDGKERIVTGNDIPKEFLENAKRIGRQTIRTMPDMKTAGGKSVKNILVRTDIGCSDSQMYDRDTNWDPNKKTFFLNEIEISSTTYFARWVKFDIFPLYGRLYAQKAREIYKHQQAAKLAKIGSKGTGKAKVPAAKVVAKKKTAGVKAKVVIKAGKMKAKRA